MNRLCFIKLIISYKYSLNCIILLYYFLLAYSIADKKEVCFSPILSLPLLALLHISWHLPSVQNYLLILLKV